MKKSISDFRPLREVVEQLLVDLKDNRLKITEEISRHERSIEDLLADLARADELIKECNEGLRK